MPKILLTGAKGFLGARIAEAMPVCPSPSLRDASEASLKKILEDTSPDILIHTAAISDIGACERDPEASYRANVWLPVALAKAAPLQKHIFFSTDQVYAGQSLAGPYREEDALVPDQVYARHKREMEERVLEISPDSVVLRASWMYDFPIYGLQNRGNFLMNLLMQTESTWSQTQYRGISYAREIVSVMEQVIELPGGIYNFGSENDRNMYETALACAKMLKKEDSILAGEGRHNLWMDGSKLRAQGIILRSTVEAFGKCLEDYGISE